MLANAVFSWQLMPYVGYGIPPGVAAVAMVLEYGVFQSMQPQRSWWRNVLMVAVANVLSWLAGMGLGRLEHFAASMAAALVLAYAVSVVVEFGFHFAVSRQGVRRLALTTVVSNLASYALLLIYLAWMWAPWPTTR